jgi:hypothetical protein
VQYVWKKSGLAQLAQVSPPVVSDVPPVVPPELPPVVPAPVEEPLPPVVPLSGIEEQVRSRAARTADEGWRRITSRP